jgi:branched-chain amino acid transport system substrate-binding protein
MVHCIFVRGAADQDRLCRRRQTPTHAGVVRAAATYALLAVAMLSTIGWIAGPAVAQTAVALDGQEIRIGNTTPYTGPAAAYSLIAKTIAAYFTKINAEGGVNGRKINFISYDDSYNPAKTVELTRKLVEEDRALAIFAGVGTATSAAVRPYLNANKIPQLFVASGASMWDQPREFPWSMGFQPNYQTEAHIHAQYLLENHPQGRIAILYQDDEFGRDYVKGMKDALGGKIPVVAEAAYKVGDTTVFPQIAKLKASGADIFFDVTTPKFAIQAIRRTAELGWKPIHIITSVAESVATVLQPAGLENAEGLLSAGYVWETDNPAVTGLPAFRDFTAFTERYLPDGVRSNSLTVYGYLIAEAMVEVLRRCGDDLSRDNVMKQAASLKGLQLPMLLPGISINTSAADYAPLEQMLMRRFTGGKWEHIGQARSGVDPGAVSDGFKAIFNYGTATKQTAGQQNANTVTMMTGTFGGTYVQMGADLATVLDDGAKFRLLPIVGRGSVQAVADILFLRGVDVGIVRKDTLAYLERKGFASNIHNQLGYVTKLYNEEMHVVADRDIRSLQDLDGKSVAVDLPDGGTFVTSISVFERLGIKPHLVYVEPRVALEMLRKGQIDAMIAVEGKPLSWLSQLADSNLHLVPIEYTKELQEDYLPTQLTSEDYPQLIAPGERVDTIAAEAILASYNWRPSADDRYRRLSNLIDKLFSQVAQLQRPPFHPKWHEVALRATVTGWTRVQPAQEWINRNLGPATPSPAAVATPFPLVTAPPSPVAAPPVAAPTSSLAAPWSPAAVPASPAAAPASTVVTTPPAPVAGRSRESTVPARAPSEPTATGTVEDRDGLLRRFLQWGAGGSVKP